MSPTHLLIVHPEPSARALIASMLQTLGHRLREATNDRAAVRMLEAEPAALVLLGGDPADDETMELLDYLRRKHPGTAAVVLWPSLPPDRTREAQRRGASAVLKYPLPATGLRAAVAQALGQPEPAVGHAHAAPRPAAENGDHHPAGNGNGNAHAHAMPTRPTAAAVPQADGAPALIGDDPCVRQAVELAASIASARSPVLIVGEAGTGKSLLARTMHARGARRDGPFVAMSCVGLKDAALEAELFGRRGATPEDDRPGRLAQAHGGTLYLDEVAALSPALQFELLQFLQGGEFEPVGSSRPVRSDCRLVLATAEDLASLVELGTFRADLYYRISVATLKLPPLRQRGGDVERLAEHFRARFAREVGRPVAGFSPEALEALRRHDWPDNVPELASVVERAVLLCRGGRIEPAHLELNPRPATARASAASPSHPGSSHAPIGILPLKEALEGPERQLILQALEALNWNRQETARVLDINRTTLYKKMKKYNLLYDEPVWAN